jgi:hypothetical protein
MDQLGTLSKSLTYDTLICMERIEINFICTKRRPNEDINKCWSSVHNFGKSGLSSERAACCNFFCSLYNNGNEIQGFEISERQATSVTD